ncbi:MAG: hypothetical protein P1U63_02230 [Coxiellaceae bacterium]|nr:hypothetical protein [Coxiellaceae bacterium]
MLSKIINSKLGLGYSESKECQSNRRLAEFTGDYLEGDSLYGRTRPRPSVECLFEDPEVYTCLSYTEINDWWQEVVEDKVDSFITDSLPRVELFNAMCEGVLRRCVAERGHNWLDMVNDPDCNFEWFFGEAFYFDAVFAEKYMEVLKPALGECADIVTRLFSQPRFQVLVTDADMLLSILNYASTDPVKDGCARILLADGRIKALLKTQEQIETARQYAPRVINYHFAAPVVVSAALVSGVWARRRSRKEVAVAAADDGGEKIEACCRCSVM